MAIIDFNKNNSSGSGGTADLKNYWTSAQTESAITEATQDFITSGDAKTQIESYNYITSSDIPDVSNFVTSGDVQIQIDESLSGVTVDLSDYYTSAETETAINTAINNIDLSSYVTSADTQAINSDIATLSGIVQTDEQVTAAALVDLDTRIIALSGATSGLNNYVTSGQVATQIENYNYVTSGQVETQITSKNYITSAATQNMVTSTNIRTLLKVTQQQYSDLVSGGTVDANTAYYIV